MSPNKELPLESFELIGVGLIVIAYFVMMAITGRAHATALATNTRNFSIETWKKEVKNRLMGRYHIIVIPVMVTLGTLTSGVAFGVGTVIVLILGRLIYFASGCVYLKKAA